MEIEETITTEAELQEVANRDQGPGPRPEDPGTLTTHPAKPVTSIGDSESQLGTVLTVMAAHGEISRAPAQDTTETLLRQKKFQIENLTSSRK